MISQQALRHFGKSRAALAERDMARLEAQLFLEAPDVGHADAVREVLEHALIVGGVAHVHPAVDLGWQIAPE